jgi:peptide/nickel transport system permease protein
MRLTPGDPVDIAMGQGDSVDRRDRAVAARIPTWMSRCWRSCGSLLDAVRGDLGYSYVQKRPVTAPLPTGCRPPSSWRWVPVISLLVAMYRIISACGKTLVDRPSMAGSFVGISMPSFWLGIILILFFSVRLHWLPVQGRIDFGLRPQQITGLYVVDSLLTVDWPALKSSIEHLILPSVALAAGVAAIIARVLRSSMVETLRQDYVTLARAKGQTESRVVAKHALRNALIPTVTVVGLQVGVLLGGNMIVETVFGWPGLGRLVVDAIFQRDFPLVQASVMVYAFIFVFAT